MEVLLKPGSVLRLVAPLESVHVCERSVSCLYNGETLEIFASDLQRKAVPFTASEDKARFVE